MFKTKPRLDMPRHLYGRVRGADGPDAEVAAAAAMRNQRGRW
jgi:hypothetical protein